MLKIKITFYCYLIKDTELYFTDMSSYYYSKLYEYWNNEDMEEILLEHFKNRIFPFNKNITSIKKLYCLVKGYNYYYKYEEKAEN